MQNEKYWTKRHTCSFQFITVGTFVHLNLRMKSSNVCSKHVFIHRYLLTAQNTTNISKLFRHKLRTSRAITIGRSTKIYNLYIRLAIKIFYLSKKNSRISYVLFS